MAIVVKLKINLRKYYMNKLSTYKKLDPDQLYYKYPEGSITFFFVPDTSNLYVAPFPTSHQDMLIDDDDLFDDVYGNLEWGSRERKEWASRSKALELTNSMLGRIAAVGEDFIISFWNKPNKNYLKEFVAKLFGKFPVLSKKKDSIIVIAPQTEPYNLLGNKVVDTVFDADTIVVSKEKKFKIGGKMYSLQDLQDLRAAIHTKNMSFGDPFVVLCHPDIDKYPMLAGYKPSSCGSDNTEIRATHPANWRKIGRQQGSPYTYSYGETFKQFIDKQ